MCKEEFFGYYGSENTFKFEIIKCKRGDKGTSVDMIKWKYFVTITSLFNCSLGRNRIHGSECKCDCEYEYECISDNFVTYCLIASQEFNTYIKACINILDLFGQLKIMTFML